MKQSIWQLLITKTDKNEFKVSVQNDRSVVETIYGEHLITVLRDIDSRYEFQKIPDL